MLVSKLDSCFKAVEYSDDLSADEVVSFFPSVVTNERTTKIISELASNDNELYILVKTEKDSKDISDYRIKVEKNSYIVLESNGFNIYNKDSFLKKYIIVNGEKNEKK